jgi:hypothetical protein
MHDVEGYSLEELEAMLETPLGTLKSRLHRVQQWLRMLPMEPFSADERVTGRRTANWNAAERQGGLCGFQCGISRIWILLAMSGEG